MRRCFGAVSFLAIVFGLLAAGCGGSGDEDDATGADNAIARVNAVCLASNKSAGKKIKVSQQKAKADGELNTEKDEIRLEVGVFVPALVDDAKSQLAAISALNSSKADQQLEQIRNAYQAWIEKAEGAPFKVVVANDVFNEARSLARAYGLTECGKHPFNFVYSEEFIE